MRRKFEEESIWETVRFMLSANNVQLMAWGTTRLNIRGRNLWFPQLVRKVTLERILQKYDGDTNFCGGTERRKMKRTTFRSILSRLITADMKQRACVDYKLNALVYENACVLKIIVNDKVEVVKKTKIFEQEACCSYRVFEV